MCLTVCEPSNDQLQFDVVQTTVEKTTLGQWKPGRLINLEPALCLGGKLGGHLVQGHVDAVARVLNIEKESQQVRIRFSLSEAISHLLIPEGSIAIDGVSLTVAGLGQHANEDFFDVAIVPHTWEHTNLSRLQVSDLVNIETDLIGKYLHRMGQAYFARSSS